MSTPPAGSRQAATTGPAGETDFAERVKALEEEKG
jgi:hypothetical protein